MHYGTATSEHRRKSSMYGADDETIEEAESQDLGDLERCVC